MKYDKNSIIIMKNQYAVYFLNLLDNKIITIIKYSIHFEIISPHFVFFSIHDIY